MAVMLADKYLLKQKTVWTQCCAFAYMTELMFPKAQVKSVN